MLGVVLLGLSLGRQRGVAVNVADVETEQASRGIVVCRPDHLAPTRMLHVELLPPMDSPLPKRKKLRLLLGTAQVEAAVVLLVTFA